MKTLIHHDKELIRLAREINDREDRIALLKYSTTTKANEAIAEALLQGQALIAAKARIPHGLWLDWLVSHSPKTTSTANRYMSLARNSARVRDLDQASSLRAALQLCAEHKHGEAEPRQWPAYMEAVGRLSKLVGYMDRNPLDQWPSEGLESFREKLEPIAAKLWPERFA